MSNTADLNKKLTEIQAEIDIKNKTLALAKKEIPKLQATKKEWDGKLNNAIKAGLMNDGNRYRLFYSIKSSAEAATNALNSKQNEINNLQRQLTQLTRDADNIKKQIKN